MAKVPVQTAITPDQTRKAAMGRAARRLKNERASEDAIARTGGFGIGNPEPSAARTKMMGRPKGSGGDAAWMSGRDARSRR